MILPKGSPLWVMFHVTENGLSEKRKGSVIPWKVGLVLGGAQEQKIN